MDTERLLAGYLVLSRTAWEDWQDAALPSGPLISMSGCVTDMVPAMRDGWDDWFDDPVSAGRARTREELRVLAVGFAAADAPALLQDMGVLPEHGGVAARLARGEVFPAEHSSPVRGFELVGHDHGTWHTWTCLGGLVTDVGQATGVRPGAWGLIEDEQQARRAAEWLTESGLGDPKVDLWAAALVVDVTDEESGVTAG